MEGNRENENNQMNINENVVLKEERIGFPVLSL